MVDCYWWMRSDIREAEYADTFCSHIICPTQSPGADGINNPGYVKRNVTERWTRFWSCFFMPNRKAKFVALCNCVPLYANDEWWANNDPTTETYWRQRKEFVDKIKDICGITMMDFEIRGDARDKYGWRETDPIEQCRALIESRFYVDIAYPFTDYRELYSLSCRFTGRTKIGTAYSPNNLPLLNSDIVQIIVVDHRSPNPDDRYTVDQAVSFIEESEIPVMLFPNGNHEEVARKMSEAMSPKTNKEGKNDEAGNK